MTAVDRPARVDGESPASVRQRSGGAGAATLGLLLLVLATVLVGGWRMLGASWQGGDLLYHQALTHTILRGELPPGGPYPGLPAYYPPGFHVVHAALMAGLGLDFAAANRLLTLAWLPVLPVGTFLLTRWLTGRPWVALLASTLTVFAGAYDLNAGRLWVNSLFMGGHVVYPVYPRDIVFGLLPFAVLAFIRALAAARAAPAMAWAAIAGALFGACALVQVQLLLPLPPALAAVSLVVALRRPDRRWRALGALAVTGIVVLAVFAPWLAGVLDVVRRNGGVAFDSAGQLVAARYGPWQYPRELGLLLPLGIVGSGVAFLFLRRSDGPRPGGVATGRWLPAMPEGPIVLVAWMAVAFVLAVLYQADWPLEDALRPQRLWLLSSQPMAILAAIGLVTLAEDAAARWRSTRIGRPALVGLAVGAAVLLASVPATLATALLLADTWNRPAYAHLDLDRDGVPAFGELLPGSEPRSTVLTYEDWSSLLWYETGEHVVAVVPAGFAKLAFDPAVFTGRGQEERRAHMLAAFDGDPAHLADAALEDDASAVVLARRGDRLGLLDASAAMAARRPGAVRGPAAPVEGNGWDGLALTDGASLDLDIAATGPVDLEIRVLDAPAGEAGADRQLAVEVVAPDGTVRSQTAVEIPAPGNDEWVVLRAPVSLEPGDRLRLRAEGPVTVQSVRGFMPSGSIAVGERPLPGWRIATATDDAVLLARDR